MMFCNCPVDDCDIKAGNGICDVSDENLRHSYDFLPCRKIVDQKHVTGIVMSVVLWIHLAKMVVPAKIMEVTLLVSVHVDILVMIAPWYHVRIVTVVGGQLSMYLV